MRNTRDTTTIRHNIKFTKYKAWKELSKAKKAFNVRRSTIPSKFAYFCAVSWHQVIKNPPSPILQITRKDTTLLSPYHQCHTILLLYTNNAKNGMPSCNSYSTKFDAVLDYPPFRVLIPLQFKNMNN